MNDNITRKIKALLARAADQTNEHEADACRTRAMEMAARYGIEASQLSADDNPVIRKDITFSGSYTDMQSALLSRMAHALHCTYFHFVKPRSTSVTAGVIFGRKTHIERVLMLHSMLSPQMITGAKRAYENLTIQHLDTDARVAKRSWMRGFIDTITGRLHDIEAQAAPGYARTDHNDTHTSGELVLRTDAQQAHDLAHTHYPNVSTTRRRKQINRHSYSHGTDAARNTDLGQTRVQQGAKAITV